MRRIELWASPDRSARLFRWGDEHTTKRERSKTKQNDGRLAGLGSETLSVHKMGRRKTREMAWVYNSTDGTPILFPTTITRSNLQRQVAVSRDVIKEGIFAVWIEAFSTSRFLLRQDSCPALRLSLRLTLSLFSPFSIFPDLILCQHHLSTSPEMSINWNHTLAMFRVDRADLWMDLDFDQRILRRYDSGSDRLLKHRI